MNERWYVLRATGSDQQKADVNMQLYICEALNYATQSRRMRREATSYLSTETNPVAIPDYVLDQKESIPNGSIRCGAVVFRQLYPGY